MAMPALRRWIWVFRIVCATVLVVGATATVETHEEHWVERGGKVVVALALILTYAQFRYEVKNGRAEDAAREAAAHLIERKTFVTPGQEIELLDRVTTTVRSRYDADRAFILLNALAAAAIGELVSAFGGLVLLPFS